MFGFMKKEFYNDNFFNYSIRFRGDNAGRPDPFRPGPHKARTTRVGLPHPAHFMQAENTGPPRILLGLRARGPAHFFFNYFLFYFYDKTFNV